LRLFDRLVGYLPRYAPWAAKVGNLLNARNRSPIAAKLGQWLTGFAAERSLPEWSQSPFRAEEAKHANQGREVALFVDTFNTWFEPENARAAMRVLEAAGYRVIVPTAGDGARPLCCGRTFLSAGLVEEGRAEAKRLMAAMLPYALRGVPIVGLEPSCLFALKDELASLLPGADAAAIGERAQLFEAFLASEHAAGRLDLKLKALPQSQALLHGHCHQKAFGAISPVMDVLKLIPGAKPELIESSCCGMAGSFGYEASHYEVSMQMAELSLLPAVRAQPDAMVVADGTSCRHQIKDGAQREAVHVAVLLARQLGSAQP
jgi:Fe-S oxidoreductase